MLNALRSFFLAPIYKDDPEKTQEARTTHSVGIVLLGLGVFSSPFIFLLPSPIKEFALGGTGVGIFVWLFTIYLVKRGNHNLAKIIILVLNTVNLYSVIYATGGLTTSTIFTTLFLLALANLLFPRRGAIIYGSVLLILASILYGLGLAGLTQPSSTQITLQSIFFVFSFTLISVASILAISSTNYQRNLDASRKNESELRTRNIELDQLRDSLETRVTERTGQLEKRASQLEAISSVARSIATLQNMEELLPVITQLASKKFGYYHVGIFLLNESGEFAFLRATNSEGGQRMLNRQHNLKLDTNSIVGFSTSRGEPRIALDVGADAVFFNNPDLPDTRSEMALPLRVGSNVIGALDVQSTEPNAFTKDDVAILSTLADQIAIAIENARLFTEAQESLNETEETFSRYVKQEWAGFANQSKNTGYVFDGNRTVALDKAEKIKPLAKTGQLSLEKESTELTIPIKFRGQTVGILDVKSKRGNRQWTQDEITLLESAAERAAFALENARLVESAQRRSARERAIGEISTKIGAVSDIDAIMQTAVEELGRRIGGTAEVIFELGSDQE